MERPLTGHIRPDRDPLTLDEYEEVGGYQGLRKAILSMSRHDVIEEVKRANLRGRGGAGFPTGVKWDSVPMGEEWPDTRYLIADADEMEPGTFKDRLLMEGNPHQFLEGIIISAYAIQAQSAYIFLRWEYRVAEYRIRQAIGEAYSRNYLGEKILGSNYRLHLHVHISAGRYICGEGSALVNSLEGKRAVPVAKPPLQTESGLWGMPTVVDNVETLCNVPHIIRNGADWFKGLSRCDDGGTKIFGLSGRVNRPGAWELPMGTTIREILEDQGGGMREGYRLRALIPGGASTEFLTEEHLHLPMDYDTIQGAGSRFGTANIIVLDDKTCPVGVVHNLMHFFARESCGWCTPCREGLPWIEKILLAIEQGDGRQDDLHILEQHTSWLWLGRTYCALAPGAVEPLKSALKLFREDFDRHVVDRRCPWT